MNIVAAGHITTIVGVFLTCIVALLLLMHYVPDLFENGISPKLLLKSPAQTSDGKTNGLIFITFMNATIGNIAAGSFVSVILPYSARRNQTKDKSPKGLEK